MKIHYLVTSLETGGAEFAIPDIVTTLQSIGHEVSIIACEPRDMGAAERLTAAGLSYQLLANRRRLLPIMLKAYLAVIRNNRPDVIWTSLSWATCVGQCAGKLAGIPVISFKHSASVRSYTYRMRNLSQLWVGDSQTVVDFLHHTMHIPTEKILPWPLFQANTQAPVAAKWDGQSVLQLGSVGRLHEVKNYAGLIDALAAYITQYPGMRHRLRLTLLGDGPEREALQVKIDKLNLGDVVALPGFSAEVGKFLSHLHLYVQTSRYEGMCLALHEAMNAGLPVMATPVGEMRDAVQEEKTGFVLSGELPQALESALNRAFADPERLGHYGDNAREYVLQKFGHEQYVRAAERILGQLPKTLHQQYSFK